MPRVKSLVKNALMRIYLGSGLPATHHRVAARLGRGRLTVVTTTKSGPTGGITGGSRSASTEFRQQRLLSENYRVVPLLDAVRRLSRKGSAEQLVAITFDRWIPG